MQNTTFVPGTCHFVSFYAAVNNQAGLKIKKMKFALSVINID